MMTIRFACSLLLVLGLFTMSTLRAQRKLPKPEQVYTIVSRPLVVMIEEVDEKRVKRLIKNGENEHAETYKADVAQHNANIKEVIEKFWPYNNRNTIQYKTHNEVTKMYMAKDRSYTLVRCLSGRFVQGSQGGYPGGGGSPAVVMSTPNSGDYLYDNDLLWDEHMHDNSSVKKHPTIFVVGTLDQLHQPTFSFFLPERLPSKKSLIVAVNNMKVTFEKALRQEAKEAKEAKAAKKPAGASTTQAVVANRARLLTRRVLLVEKGDLAADVTEEKFKDHYPFPYKFADANFIDQAVVDKDSTYAVLMILPTSLPEAMQSAIIDAGDGQPIVDVGNDAKSKGADETGPKLSAAVLQEIVDKAGGKQK